MYQLYNVTNDIIFRVVADQHKLIASYPAVIMCLICDDVLFVRILIGISVLLREISLPHW